MAEVDKSPPRDEPKVPKDVCYICRGVGHWARDCTSLPAVYLAENAPKCYNCHGIGHFARFCPNVLFPRYVNPTIVYDPIGHGYFDDHMTWFPLIQDTRYILSAVSEDPAESVPRSEQDNGSAVEIIISQQPDKPNFNGNTTNGHTNTKAISA